MAAPSDSSAMSSGMSSSTMSAPDTASTSAK
jgi:hypothetical protein